VARDFIVFQHECKSVLFASVVANTLLRLTENMIHVDVPGPLDVMSEVDMGLVY
jgi:hypothetical protein